jgi:hypothetical protein
MFSVNASLTTRVKHAAGSPRPDEGKDETPRTFFQAYACLLECNLISEQEGESACALCVALLLACLTSGSAQGEVRQRSHWQKRRGAQGPQPRPIGRRTRIAHASIVLRFIAEPSWWRVVCAWRGGMTKRRCCCREDAAKRTAGKRQSTGLPQGPEGTGRAYGLEIKCPLYCCVRAYICVRCIFLRGRER